MFKQSLVTKSSVDASLLPLLTIRCCTSEAFESLNGPRFCAQDTLTGTAYEVRSVSQFISDADASVDDAGDVEERYSQRLHALLHARASLPGPSPFLSFPSDANTVFDDASGVVTVAVAESFCGLSLGDLVRCGWGLLEESVLRDILHVVEWFCYAAPLLPPHLNVSSDCIKRALDVRDGSAERVNPSRWVIGDWLLLCTDDSPDMDRPTFEGLLSDVEWTLHSSFLELNIAASSDGMFLSSTQVEQRISEVMDRVHMFFDVELPDFSDRAKVRTVLAHKLRFMTDTALLAADGDDGDSLAGSLLGRQSSAASPLTSATPLLDGLVLPLDVPPSEMTLKEKLAYHQMMLRTEQAAITRQRRKTAPLPPMPQKMSFQSAEEDAEYSLQFLSSPLQPTVGTFLTTTESTALIHAPQPGDGVVERGSSRACRERTVLQSAIELSIRAEETAARQERTRAESERLERESLRALLMRELAVTQQRSSPRDDQKTDASPTRRASASAARNVAPRGSTQTPPPSARRNPPSGTATAGVERPTRQKKEGSPVKHKGNTPAHAPRATPNPMAATAAAPAAEKVKSKAKPKSEGTGFTSPRGLRGAPGGAASTKPQRQPQKRASPAKDTVSPTRPSCSPEPLPPPGSKRMVQLINPEDRPRPKFAESTAANTPPRPAAAVTGSGKRKAYRSRMPAPTKAGGGGSGVAGRGQGAGASHADPSSTGINIVPPLPLSRVISQQQQQQQHQAAVSTTKGSPRGNLGGGSNNNTPREVVRSAPASPRPLASGRGGAGSGRPEPISTGATSGKPSARRPRISLADHVAERHSGGTPATSPRPRQGGRAATRSGAARLSNEEPQTTTSGAGKPRVSPRASAVAADTSVTRGAVRPVHEASVGIYTRMKRTPLSKTLARR